MNEWIGGMPTKAALLLVAAQDGGPIVGARVFADALLERPSASGAAERHRMPLGNLVTDHLGYASWDLDPVARRLALSQASEETALVLASIRVYFAGPAGIEHELVDDEQRSSEAFFKRILVDRAGLTLGGVGDNASIQSPRLVDLQLSPGSVSSAVTHVLGEDGCQALLPSSATALTYNVTQYVRAGQARRIGVSPGDGAPSNAPISIAMRANEILNLGISKGVEAALSSAAPKGAKTGGPKTPLAELESIPLPASAAVGMEVTYRVQWVPAGHGLGDLVASLPLAPGEMTRISVVEWERSAVDSRIDSSQVADSLDHELVHDRLVDDAVRGAVHEWQRGGTAGAAFKLGPLSIGGGYSTSSGDRSVTLETVNRLADQIGQRSSSLRQLRSSVIVESHQQELATGTSRVIRNYNHSHSLTILYYAVLRHFRVSVEPVAVRPTLMLRRSMPAFSIESVFKYRPQIAESLLDESLRPSLEVAERYAAYEMAKAQNLLVLEPEQSSGDVIVREIWIATRSGQLTNEASGYLIVYVGYRPDPTEPLRFVSLLRQDFDRNELSNDGFMMTANADDLIASRLSEYAEDGLPTGDVRLSDLRSVHMNIYPYPNGSDEKTHIHFTSIQAFAVDGDGVQYPLFAVPLDRTAPAGGLEVKARVDGVRLPAKRPVDPVISNDERIGTMRLLAHLNANLAHYWTSIWAGEDSATRRRLLRDTEITIAGQKGVPLLDVVDNDLLDVVDDACVFPIRADVSDGVLRDLSGIDMAVRSERLLSLPTRGVFAEAKLGSCNASEIIDDTRFWDWQKSPIPDAADPMAPIDLGSRRDRPDLTPAALPASGVTIVQPPATDPVSTAGAIGLLSQSGLFRNQDASELVKSLTESLKTPAPAADDPKVKGSGPGKSKDGKAGDDPKKDVADDKTNAPTGKNDEASGDGEVPSLGADAGALVGQVSNPTSGPSVPAPSNPSVPAPSSPSKPKKSASYEGGLLRPITVRVSINGTQYRPAYFRVVASRHDPVSKDEASKGVASISQHLYFPDDEPVLRVDPSWKSVHVRLTDGGFLGSGPQLTSPPNIEIRVDDVGAVGSLGRAGARVNFKWKTTTVERDIDLTVEAGRRVEDHQSRGETDRVTNEIGGELGLPESKYGTVSLKGTRITGNEKATSSSGTKEDKNSATVTEKWKFVVQVIDLSLPPDVEWTPVD